MQVTALSEDLKNIVDDIISSYETRIQNIESILEPIHQTLDTFQKSYLETKQEQEKASIQLRENLARNHHLRRKDFDQMMKNVLLTQDEKENLARDLLVSYLNQQKEMMSALKDNLAKAREALNNGQVDRIKELQGIIKEMFAQAEKRKEEVTTKLRELQEEQTQMLSRVKALLAKGEQLRIKDFKEMLREFRLQHQERIAQKHQRKQEVRRMLISFKKKRLEWRESQKKKTPPVSNSLNINQGKQDS